MTHSCLPVPSLLARVVRTATATLAGLALLAGSLPVHAEYPDHTVRIINPYGPGGSGDIIQRLVAQKMAERTGKTFIVELKPGASGRITYDYVAKSSPDGYTLAALDPGYSILPAVFNNLTWDHANDLVPVTRFARTPHAVVAHGQSRFKSLAELVDYARSNPGKVTFGHSGAGTTGFVSMQQFMRDAKVTLADVPYKNGAEALTAVLSGSVDLMVTGAPTIVPFMNEGKVRVLGLTCEQRWPGAENAPTLVEQGFNVVNYLWFGLMAPKGTPQPVVDYLHTQAVAALADPGVKQALQQQAAQSVGMAPAELKRLMQEDVKSWGQILKAANVKPAE